MLLQKFDYSVMKGTLKDVISLWKNLQKNIILLVMLHCCFVTQSWFAFAGTS